MKQHIYRIRTWTPQAGTSYAYIMADTKEEFLEKCPKMKRKGAYAFYELVAIWDNYTQAYLGTELRT